MVENFPNLIKDMNLHIYEFQQTPSRINSVSQDTVKLLKEKSKEVLQASRETVAHGLQRSLSTVNSRAAPGTAAVRRRWRDTLKVLKLKTVCASAVFPTKMRKIGRHSQIKAKLVRTPTILN